MGWLKNLFSAEARQTRQENRTIRLQSRLQKRTQVQSFKSQANIAAYQNGIDPKQSMWKGISSLGESVGNMASNIFGNPLSRQGITNNTPLITAQGGGTNQMSQQSIIFIVAGLLGAFLILKKK